MNISYSCTKVVQPHVESVELDVGSLINSHPLLQPVLYTGPLILPLSVAAIPIFRSSEPKLQPTWEEGGGSDLLLGVELTL